MHRRDLLRAAAAAAALSLVPHEAQAQAAAAWARLSPLTGSTPPAPALSEVHRAIIRTVADAIIPRTDTPGANDVNVLAWIEVVATDYYTDADRTAFLAGLDAMDEQAKALTGQPLAALSGADLAKVMDALDAPADRTTSAARGYTRLKGLVVHGYFTSERVQKEVLKTQIMPGRFDGSAPHLTRGAGRDE